MRLLSLILVLTSLFSFAQVNTSSSDLSFGDVFTDADKTMSVQLSNSGAYGVSVDTILIFDSAFSYSLSQFVIAPGNSVDLNITFEPNHNIIHNTEAVVVLSNGNEVRLDIVGNGRYVDTYYSSTFNKSHQDLKDELKSVISANYVSLGYNTARDRMYGEIDNVAGTMTCVYTGRTANFTTRSGANSNSFNCEHTWPQSLFSSGEPEKSDIHHLFPTDVTANSRRSNYPFAIVSNPSWSVGGSKQSGSIFEPRDLQKGASARALMYFTIRHSNAGGFITNQESILKDWHTTYPPSTAEKSRNDAIFSYQKNRNPFVDHPEFIERINNLGTNDPTPSIKELSVSQNAINFGSVTKTDTRNVYLVNTGNQNLSGINNITSNGKLVINSVESDVDAGESSQIQVGFASSLADGNYTDSLVLNVQSQSNQTFIIPVSFSIGVSSIEIDEFEMPTVFFNSGKRSILLKGDLKAVDAVKIYSATGQEIFFNEIKSSFTDIPFIGHPDGIYFVVINANGFSSTSKVLVY